MPSTAPLTVNDGTANVVFSPDSVSSTHAVFQNLAEPVVNLRKLVHLDRPANAKASEVRRSLRVNVPYTVTQPDGSVSVKQLTMKVEMIAPVDTTAAQRLALRTLASNALTNADVVKVFDNPEWMW